MRPQGVAAQVTCQPNEVGDAATARSGDHVFGLRLRGQPRDCSAFYTAIQRALIQPRYTEYSLYIQPYTPPSALYSSRIQYLFRVRYE